MLFPSILSLKRVLLAASVCILSACGGGGGSDYSTGGAATPTGSMTGVVRDARTADVLAGATVASGGVTSTTSADGTYTLAGLALAGNVVVVVNKAGFAQGYATGKVTANTVTQANANLSPVSGTGTVAVTTGGTVSVTNSTAAVDLPANGIITASGGAATGNVTVQLSIIDPASNASNMPGNYTASVGMGTAVIESFGALEVTLKDATGAKLNLAPGKTATIRIPVNSRSTTLPATIPLFYFNETTGLWVEEGSATLQGTAPNLYYGGTVSHFSTWNADYLYSSIYINGCVKDTAGNPVAGQKVRSNGKDYSGAATVFTDASGNFRVAGKKNGTLEIFTVNNVEMLINTPTPVAPSNSDVTLSQCL